MTAVVQPARSTRTIQLTRVAGQPSPLPSARIATAATPSPKRQTTVSMNDLTWLLRLAATGR